MTGQLNKNNGLQTWWTKGLLITAVWRNGGGSGNINSSAFNKQLCLADSEVLRKPPLRQAANRYALASLERKISHISTALSEAHPRTSQKTFGV